MKLGHIYDFVIKKGIEVDPRGERAIRSKLRKVRQAFESLSKDERELVDSETLKNPYNDTRILYGSRDIEVKSIFVGIDMKVGEILLADRMREKGVQVDLILAHHPEGMALAGLYNVMHLQIDILSKYGISVDIARDLLNKRIKEVERKTLPINHARSVDAARILDIPFMCCHTPADNHVAAYLQRLMDSEKPNTVREVLKILKSIPEYKEAARMNAGPRLILGEEKKPAGKVFIDMTGGTEGSKEVFGRLSQAGIGTIVAMHLSEEHFKKVEHEYINVVFAGHISSDGVGMNLLLDKLMEKGKFKIIAGSGFRRIVRKQTRWA